MRIAFTTFGCKTNQFDTEQLIDLCRKMGFEIVSCDEVASIYVVNTCTVTSVADAQARQMIRRLKRQNPNSKIIAVGCSVQNHKNCYLELGDVDFALGVRCADELMQVLQNEISGCDKCEVNLPCEMPIKQSRARALLKIQDGCNMRCTYCAVWMARGKSSSVPSSSVIESYKKLTHYDEVMLTGVHIGQYGLDLDPKISFWQLLHMLVSKTDGPRIRLGSLNPNEIDETALSLLKNRRICRHIHLSVQSCSKNVLSRMGRKYSPEDIISVVYDISKKVPDIAIGADIIVGFPGESEEDHKYTLELIEALPISYLHVFPYSLRPGTVASKLPGNLTNAVKKARARELIKLGSAKKREFIQSQIGKSFDAVVISRKPDSRGFVNAVTDNYITLTIPTDNCAYGKIKSAYITNIENEEVLAQWA